MRIRNKNINNVYVPIYFVLVLSVWPYNCSKSAEEGSACNNISLKNIEIQNLVKDRTCTTTQQCNYIAYGFMYCGSPSSYLIYSINIVDKNYLISKVNEYNALIESCSKSDGMAGPCVTPSIPNLSCLSGICTNIGITP